VNLDPDVIRQLLADIDDAKRHEAEAVAAALSAGIELGREMAKADAEAAVDESWQQLSRRIRSEAERRRSTIVEPPAREQHDDLIWFADGEWQRLTSAAGDDVPLPIHPQTRTERRAA
jgi:hypothetical protein